jgi:mRNA-degrading endonuclease RelE of RelBE toxin-antitoxin system
MYKIEIKRPAERDLRQLPASTFKRVNQQILALSHKPRRHRNAGY